MIGKIILIYIEYMHNESQNDFDLLANQIYIEIIIILVINSDFFRCQGNTVV